MVFLFPLSSVSVFTITQKCFHNYTISDFTLAVVLSSRITHYNCQILDDNNRLLLACHFQPCK